MHWLSVGGLNLPDKRVDPDCWLRSGFESPRVQLVVSLFQDPISYGSFTGATLYVLCLDRGLIKLYPFSIFFPLHIFHRLDVFLLSVCPSSTCADNEVYNETTCTCGKWFESLTSAYSRTRLYVQDFSILNMIRTV